MQQSVCSCLFPDTWEDAATKLLRIGWRDMIQDTGVLRRTGLPGIDTMLTKAQLHWSGHIIRMGEEHLPKRLLYGELQGGKRSMEALQRYVEGSTQQLPD